MKEIKINIGDQSYVEEVLKPLEALAAGQEPKEPVITPEAKKAAKEGIYTIAELATELGTNAKALRKYLRDNGFQKAGKRWEWPLEDLQLEAIRNHYNTEDKPAEPKPTASDEEPETTEESEPTQDLESKLDLIQEDSIKEEGA